MAPRKEPYPDDETPHGKRHKSRGQPEALNKFNKGKKPRRTVFSKEQVVRALEKCKGNLRQTAVSLGITWQTLKNYIDRWKLDQTLFDIKEQTIDYVEGKLMSAISKENVRAIQFYLVTQATHRGYMPTSRRLVGQDPNSPPLNPAKAINFERVLERLPIEMVRALRDAIREAQTEAEKAQAPKEVQALPQPGAVQEGGGDAPGGEGEEEAEVS